VAPEILYNEMFTKVFKNSLFELSSHHCGNFVIQALISHARRQDQVCVLNFIGYIDTYALCDS
jgi:nucleolar protein 9